MRFSLLLIGILSFKVTEAQSLYMPMERSGLYNMERSMHQSEENYHSSMHPYLERDVKEFQKEVLTTRDSAFLAARKHRRFWNSLIASRWVKVRSGEFSMQVDPLIDFRAGHEFSDQDDLFTNTRGIRVQGKIGERFGFHTEFYENQSSFPNYLNDFILLNALVPGEGITVPEICDEKPCKTFDYTGANGSIQLDAKKYFSFQLGHGKHFIGDGYRSLLLSDNAYDYPYFKITTKIWKLQYTNLYTEYSNLWSGYGGAWSKKYAASHYLDMAIGKRLKLGIFESIVWQAQDSTGKRGFDVNYVNPIILMRSVQINQGHGDNLLLGFTGSYKLSRSISFYSQLLIDDFNLAKVKSGWGYFQNKLGFQTGFKFYDLFGVQGLFFRTEFNQVRPYTYAHKKPLQNYSHLGQALAHPLGANFSESVSHINYRIRRWEAALEFMYANYGLDETGSHLGKNIFISDLATDLFSYGNFIGQGSYTELYLWDLKIAYVINRANNMRVQLGFVQREERGENNLQKSTNFVHFGLSAGIRNRYRDF